MWDYVHRHVVFDMYLSRGWTSVKEPKTNRSSKWFERAHNTHTHILSYLLLVRLQAERERRLQSREGKLIRIDAGTSAGQILGCVDKLTPERTSGAGINSPPDKPTGHVRDVVRCRGDVSPRHAQRRGDMGGHVMPKGEGDMGATSCPKERGYGCHVMPKGEGICVPRHAQQRGNMGPRHPHELMNHWLMVFPCNCSVLPLLLCLCLCLSFFLSTSASLLCVEQSRICCQQCPLRKYIPHAEPKWVGSSSFGIKLPSFLFFIRISRNLCSAPDTHTSYHITYIYTYTHIQGLFH